MIGHCAHTLYQAELAGIAGRTGSSGWFLIFKRRANKSAPWRSRRPFRVLCITRNSTSIGWVYICLRRDVRLLQANGLNLSLAVRVCETDKTLTHTFPTKGVFVNVCAGFLSSFSCRFHSEAQALLVLVLVRDRIIILCCTFRQRFSPRLD